MKKSARQLGREYNLSDREFNVILRNKGYLAGEPGNYEPTSKALPFVEERENYHGTGGYSHMYKSETIRRYDDSIMNEPDMEITDEDVAEVRAYLSERNRLLREKRKADSEAYWAEHSPIHSERTVDDSSSENEFPLHDLFYAIVGAGLIAYTGIKWAVPKVVNLWNEEVAPKIVSRAQKKKCPKCDSKMRYDKKQNCWICKKCGAVKQETNEAPSE